MFRIKSIRVVLVALLTVNPLIEAATVSLNSPSIGQNYAVDAPISYSGEGTWAVGEQTTIMVTIELLWYDPNLAQGLGIVTESDGAVITYDDPGVASRAYGFTNSKDAYNNSNLTAKPYQNNSTTYKIRAMPEH